MTATHTSTLLPRRQPPMTAVRSGDVRLGATIFGVTSARGRAP